MKKENIVIIGMGFLATYVMPCYKKLLGDSISTHVVGIKGSERGLKEKQAESTGGQKTGSDYSGSETKSDCRNDRGNAEALLRNAPETGGRASGSVFLCTESTGKLLL